MAKKMTYEKAMKDLQGIMEDLENNKVKVNDLPEKVKEAHELLKFCRGKLRGVEEDVLSLMDND